MSSSPSAPEGSLRRVAEARYLSLHNVQLLRSNNLERGCRLKCRPRHLTEFQHYKAHTPRVASWCDDNKLSLTHYTLI
ncbi:hypothetical protein TNCV_3372371 [Trichonephila clavipes]|nr:hypothetical protein TNCV_3372371 [Trichonephila clavipes]